MFTRGKCQPSSAQVLHGYGKPDSSRATTEGGCAACRSSQRWPTMLGSCAGLEGVLGRFSMLSAYTNCGLCRVALQR